MRVAVLGRTKALFDSINALINAGHTITLIGTCKESPEYTVSTENFRKKAATLGVPFFNNPNINSDEITDLLKSSMSEIAISVNWLTVLSEKAIHAFPRGILNAHAGDLPRYRGNACPNWAILNGEKKIALTIHFMEAHSLDSGPIVIKQQFPLNDSTYIGDVYQWMEKIIPLSFLEAVNGLENGSLIPTPQPSDPQLSLRCYPRIPEDGLIDWNNNAENIVRLIRASAEPFAGAFTFWGDTKIIVWRARAGDYPCPSLAVPGHVLWRAGRSGEVAVATREGVLFLEEIELLSQGRLRPCDVLKSNRIRLTRAG